MRKYKLENLLLGRVYMKTFNSQGNGVSITYFPRQYVILQSNSQYVSYFINDISGFKWSLEKESYDRYYVEIIQNLAEIIGCNKKKISYEELIEILVGLNEKVKEK